MKAQLIVPNQDIGRSFNSGQWPPLGLLSIASYCQNRNPGLEIEIIDGELVNKEIIFDRIKTGEAGVVGISCNSFNYINGLEIAESAKLSGKRVYMGGPHPSALAETILRKRSSIDAVIRYDGERAFNDLINNKVFEEISNLIFRFGNRIKSNPIHLNHLYQIEIDFNLINLESYQKNHHKIYPFLSKESMIYFTHIGCKWRQISDGCVFCAIPEPKQIYQNQEKIWGDFKRFKEKYGIKLIKDYGDTFTADKGWVRNFLTARPKELEDMQLLVYGASRDIDEEMAGLLKELNVKYVFVGFESGNDKILKNLNKGTNTKRNLEAAQRLIDNGIGIFASYILGGPGETEETIEDTFNLAKRISEYGAGKGPDGRNLVELSNASPFIVMPGTRIYNELFGHEDDLFLCEDYTKEFIRKKCNFKHSSEKAYIMLIERCNEISQLSPQKNYLGWEIK